MRGAVVNIKLSFGESDLRCVERSSLERGGLCLFDGDKLRCVNCGLLILALAVELDNLSALCVYLELIFISARDKFYIIVRGAVVRVKLSFLESNL